jgi:hypothetical protein
MEEQMKKKRLGVFFAALALASMPRTCLGQCEFGPASPRLPTGLSLHIRVDVRVAEIGAPVVVHAELSNQSGVPVSIWDRWWPARDYELHLRDAEGREVPLTESGRKMRAPQMRTSQSRVTLPPGGMDETDQDLSGVYAVAVTGSYTLEACRDVIGWGNIYSNKLVIPFVQPPPATTQPSSQARTVDLTGGVPDLAKWKILSSVSGGSIGAFPRPPSQVPVTLHLADCAAGDSDFGFTLEIENSRSLEIQIPISLSSKPFDHPGAIGFRELVIDLGTVTNADSAQMFRRDSRLASITLFGDQSVPGTIVVLAPGERLILRLRAAARSKVPDLASLRVEIGAFDTTLSPTGNGYHEAETIVPALWATSEPTCAGTTRKGDK